MVRCRTVFLAIAAATAACSSKPAPKEQMVEVPAGPYRGCNDYRSCWVLAERSQASAFTIDLWTASIDDFRACIDRSACPAGLWNAAKTGNEAALVTWEQAHAFCAWRRARLPTPEEWEKAARGVLDLGSERRPSNWIDKVGNQLTFALPSSRDHGAIYVDTVPNGRPGVVRCARSLAPGS